MDASNNRFYREKSLADSAIKPDKDCWRCRGGGCEHCKNTGTSVAGDTGNAEADRIIDRLMSSDPDFDDCFDAAVFIRRIVIEHKGPDGFATWKDAAIAERQLRVTSQST